MVNKNNKKKMIILLLIFAIIMVVMSVSYAVFTYSRSGSELIIETGHLEFAMIDGSSVSISNQFPQNDVEGNKNTPYKFEVRNTSTDGLKLYYNVSLVTNNNEENKNYFTNDQIKYTLVKNNAIVKNSQLISSIDGLNSGVSTGEGVVLDNQAITSSKTDFYELIIWIDENVNYSSEPDENGVSNGLYNDYKYSLKVKVDASNSSSQAVLGASDVSYTNSATTCTDVECSLNELYNQISGE